VCLRLLCIEGNTRHCFQGAQFRDFTRAAISACTQGYELEPEEDKATPSARLYRARILDSVLEHVTDCLTKRKGIGENRRYLIKARAQLNAVLHGQRSCSTEQRAHDVVHPTEV